MASECDMLLSCRYTSFLSGVNCMIWLLLQWASSANTVPHTIIIIVICSFLSGVN
jgi:hypothetical protein